MGEFTGEKFIKEMERWKISLSCMNGRVFLSGGDKNALEYYQKFIALYPEYEVQVILELAKNNEDVQYSLEERAAIREADGLPGDLESAARCNILNVSMCP